MYHLISVAYDFNKTFPPPEIYTRPLLLRLGKMIECRTKETVRHSHLFCSRFEAERQYMIEAVRTPNISFTLENLLNDHRVVNAIVELVSASGHLLFFA